MRREWTWKLYETPTIETDALCIIIMISMEGFPPAQRLAVSASIFGICRCWPRARDFSGAPSETWPKREGSRAGVCPRRSFVGEPRRGGAREESERDELGTHEVVRAGASPLGISPFLLWVFRPLLIANNTTSQLQPGGWASRFLSHSADEKAECSERKVSISHLHVNLQHHNTWVTSSTNTQRWGCTGIHFKTNHVVRQL